MSRSSAWWMWPQTTPCTPRRRASRATRRSKSLDVAHRALDLQLEVLRQAPVRQAEPRAQRVEVAVEPQRELVGRVADVGQPLGALDHAVEQVAVRDPQAAAVGGAVDPLLDHLDAAEVVADVACGRTRRGCRARTRPACPCAPCAAASAPRRCAPAASTSVRRSCQPSTMSPTRNSVSHSTVRRKSSSAAGLAARRAEVQVRDPDRADPKQGAGVALHEPACWGPPVTAR